jgi:hypothetical protein
MYYLIYFIICYFCFTVGRTKYFNKGQGFEFGIAELCSPTNYTA